MPSELQDPKARPMRRIRSFAGMVFLLAAFPLFGRPMARFVESVGGRSVVFVATVLIAGIGVSLLLLNRPADRG